MPGVLIGHARVAIDKQDLTAQRDALVALDRVYVDHGLTGANRERPGLRQAMAACRHGDTLVVAKLDRLARSLPDARDSQLAELFNVARSTVYRANQRNEAASSVALEPVAA
jgi:DNA invertase Pin-like site-specific DNA recombinase